MMDHYWSGTDPQIVASIVLDIVYRARCIVRHGTALLGSSLAGM